MNLYGKAAQAAQDILGAFQNPGNLPAPLAQVFIHRKDRSPCRAWSWRNQLIVALRGHSDARGFRQWQAVGRHVRKGENAFYILSPCVKRVMDPKTGEERSVLYGYRGTPVFGLNQTEGAELELTDPAVLGWLRALPLREIAQSWGLKIEAFDGSGADCLGKFRRGEAIALGVKNLSTWAHELVHAADHRNGKFAELGQHWRSETVAELGGAVLLCTLGLKHDADLGGCWDYVQSYASRSGIDPLRACNLVLDRTCEAVSLILDTAEAINGQREEAVA